MSCATCGAPLAKDPENGETFCQDDASHDIDGSELVDDEMPNPERWTIGSDGEAGWALGRVQRARFELAQIQARYDEQIRVLNDWRDRVSAAPLRDDAFFCGHLAAYYDQVVSEGWLYGKSKTYSLPGGSLSSRAGAERVEVDADVFTDWAEANERLDLIDHKPVPVKAAIKAALVAGEVIPGAQIVRGDGTFVVTVSSEELPAVLPMPESDAA